MEYLSPLSLHILKQVVDLGSFRAAAQSLQISEPAVSAHIRRIEDHLNIQIFEQPYKRKLRTTEAGMMAYDFAVDIAVKTQEYTTLLKDLAKGESGNIRFAISICTIMFASIVSSYFRMYPKTSFVFRTGNSAEVKKILRNGLVDFAITQKIDNDSNFTHQLLHREPMVLFCSESHPLADKGIISIDDFVNNKLVTCLEGSDYNSLINDYLQKIGLNIKNSIQVEDGSLLFSVVEQGVGLGILSQSNLNNKFKREKMVVLKLDNGSQLPYIDYQLMFRNDTKLNSATKNFILYMKNEIEKLNHESK